MKDYEKIDELLNGFIDEELTQRQVTQLQHLIAHDSNIAKRLKQLQTCKSLMENLPRAEAPDTILEDVKLQLERNSLLEHPIQKPSEQQGVIQLIFKKVLSAAAVIALIGVLGTLAYTILNPKVAHDTSVAYDYKAEDSSGIIETISAVTQPETAVAEIATGEIALSGKLQLKTRAIVAVDAAIKRAAENNNLSENFSIQQPQGNIYIYSIRCSQSSVEDLLADLATVWRQFEDTRLTVQSQQVYGEIVIENVSAAQTMEIFNKTSAVESLQLAQNFANTNSPFALHRQTGIDDGSGNLITPPKPLLTSGRKETTNIPGPTAEQLKVDLQIVVEGK